MLIRRTAVHAAEITFSAEELAARRVLAEKLSLGTATGQKLLHEILSLLRHTCGLQRDGCLTLLRCRPLRGGGCRFSAEFTDRPCPRLFVSDSADDLLDALLQLRSGAVYAYCSTDSAAIQPLGDKFFVTIPQTVSATTREIAILREYAAN